MVSRLAKSVSQLRRTAKLICLVILLMAVQGYLEWNREDITARELLELGADVPLTKGRINNAYRKIDCLIAGEVTEKPTRRKPDQISFIVSGKIYRKGQTVDVHVQLKAKDLPWVNESKLRKGDFLLGKAKLFLSEESYNPFSYQSYLKRRGIDIAGDLTELISFEKQTNSSKREEFIGSLIKEFPSRNSVSVLLAAVLGEKDLLSEQTVQLFRNTGTSHLLVVSGFHIGVVFGLIFFFIKGLLRFTFLPLLYVSAESAAAIFGLVVSIYYVSLVGFSVSSTRALIFISVMVIAKLKSSRAVSLETLFVSLIIIFLIWPGAFYEAGTQLTFFAVLGLISAGALEKYLNNKNLWPAKKLLSYLTSSALICVFAWLFTAPVVYCWFDQIVWIGPIVNFLVVLLFSFFAISLGGVSLLLYALGFPGASLLVEVSLLGVEGILDVFFWLKINESI